jgi:ferrous-iron efflux pump FieF
MAKQSNTKKSSPESESKSRYALLAGWITVSIVLVLVAVKTYAWVESGSASVLASLVDSLMDAGVSTMNLLVIRFSIKPADELHRYGHGKAEGIAALFQAAFITGIAVFLLLESIGNLLRPVEIDSYSLAIGVMIFSMVMSIVMVTVQKACMKYASSLAVEADSAHYTSDIMVNAGAIVTLFALQAGAPAWIDPVFAVAVVIYLGLTVRHVAGKGLAMLMDQELPQEVRERIKQIIMSHEETRGLHDLRTRQIGMRWHISFDVEMNPEKPLKQAHASAREIELKLMEEFPQAEIMIHMDPQGDVADSRHPDKPLR